MRAAGVCVCPLRMPKPGGLIVVGVIQEAQAEGGGVGTMNTGEC